MNTEMTRTAASDEQSRTVTRKMNNGTIVLELPEMPSQATAFWTAFLMECHDLDTLNWRALRRFVAMLESPLIYEAVIAEGDAFLLTPESFRAWCMYFKETFTSYRSSVHRGIFSIVVFAARYQLRRHPEAVTLSPFLVEAIQGRELCTFLIDCWTGLGTTGVARTLDDSRLIMLEFTFENKALERMYCDYFESRVAAVRIIGFKLFSGDFEKSLGDAAPMIRGFGDFSSETFNRQVAYYREKYAHDNQRAWQAVQHIVGFYRYVLSLPEGRHVFDDGNVTPAMLCNKDILGPLLEDVARVPFVDIMPDESRERLLVVLKDVRLVGTRYVNGDAVHVDLSVVKSPFLRNVIWQYFREDVKRITTRQFRNVIAPLHILEEYKAKTDSPMDVLTNDDATYLHTWVMSRKIRESAVYHVLSNLRRLFEWADRRGLIRFGTAITAGILSYRSRSSTRGRNVKGAAAPEDVRKILQQLEEDATANFSYYVALMAVRLMIATGLRPSQLLMLDIRDIHMRQEEGYCILSGMSKTSRGDKDQIPVPAVAYKWLNELVKRTQGIREQCFDDNINNLVFLYRSRVGIKRMKDQDLNILLKNVCARAGVTHRTPYSLRKLHATILDDIDERMGHHGDLAAQAMGHRHYDTTRKHYVDLTLDEFRRLDGANAISTDEAVEEEYLRLSEGR